MLSAYCTLHNMTTHLGPRYTHTEICHYRMFYTVKKYFLGEYTVFWALSNSWFFESRFGDPDFLKGTVIETSGLMAGEWHIPQCMCWSKNLKLTSIYLLLKVGVFIFKVWQTSIFKHNVSACFCCFVLKNGIFCEYWQPTQNCVTLQIHLNYI